MRPRTLKDLEDNVFLQHDLNVFNFIIQLNAQLRAQGRDLAPVARPDFSMISDAPFELAPMPRGWLNHIDVQTAVEAYTPMYALMLPRADFIRAANSLQLDEVIGIYIGKILGTDYHLSFVKNGHPLIQLSTMTAGHRLMLHGLDCEAHARLAAQAEASSGRRAAARSSRSDGRNVRGAPLGRQGGEHLADALVQHQVGGLVERRDLPVDDGQDRAVAAWRSAGSRRPAGPPAKIPAPGTGRRPGSRPRPARIGPSGIDWPKEMVAVFTRPPQARQAGTIPASSNGARRSSSSWRRPQARQVA